MTKETQEYMDTKPINDLKEPLHPKETKEFSILFYWQPSNHNKVNHCSNLKMSFLIPYKAIPTVPEHNSLKS